MHHIGSGPVPLVFDPKGYHKPSKWKWTNWMTVEFNLLYRWHSMIPDTLKLGEKDTFGKTGFALLQEKWTVSRLVNLLCPEGGGNYEVSLTRKDWVRE